MSEETKKFEIGERVYCERFPDAHLTVHAPLGVTSPLLPPELWLQWKSDGEVHSVEASLVQKYKTREQLEAEVARLTEERDALLAPRLILCVDENARLRALLQRADRWANRVECVGSDCGSEDEDEDEDEGECWTCRIANPIRAILEAEGIAPLTQAEANTLEGKN